MNWINLSTGLIMPLIKNYRRIEMTIRVKILIALTIFGIILGIDAKTKGEKMKKIIIVLTSHDQLGSTGKKTGAYLSEITHPYEEFIKAGYEVDFVSPKGGKAPLDGVDLNDPINAKWMKNSQFTKKLETTSTPKDIDPRNYQAIFLAGGHGTVFDLPQDENLSILIGNIYDDGGVVGAVCHGPSGLVNVKLKSGEYLVSGKQVSGFTNEEEVAVGLDKQVPFLLEAKLIERGGKYSKASKFEAYSISDQRLVTGQNPASATGVGEKMIQALKSK